MLAWGTPSAVTGHDHAMGRVCRCGDRPDEVDAVHGRWVGGGAPADGVPSPTRPVAIDRVTIASLYRNP